MNKQTIKGILFVIAGASSCAIVGVLVKLAVIGGFKIPELIFSQAFIGAAIVLILNIIARKKSSVKSGYNIRKKDKIKLLLGGIPLALTNTFYYLSIQHVPVSVSTVMLMQSVWLGVVIDYFVNKVKPSPIKLVSIIIVLVGTILATDVLNSDIRLDFRGVLFGFLAAVAYSFTFLVTNNIGKEYKPLARSMYIVFGALVIITIIWGNSALSNFDPKILWTWGAIIALFSTILPPLLLTKGMPLIDIGLGSIIASMELPVTVAIAYILLNEHVDILQWLGILLILFAIALMNIYSKKSPNLN